MRIRAATTADFEAIWPIFREISSAARGQGLATAMCEHSQRIAVELGYKAMQFNFVASSNLGAIRLWNQLGFETVGRLPKAFDHPTQGYIDALVMYKWLDKGDSADRQDPTVTF